MVMYQATTLVKVPSLTTPGLLSCGVGIERSSVAWSRSSCRPRSAEVWNTVKTVATEIQSPKFTEIKLICVAFQLGTHLQWPTPTEISSFFQSEDD